MKIRTRFVVSASFALCTSLAMVAVVLVTSRHVSDTIDKHRVADEVARGVFDLHVLLNDYLLHHEDRAQRQWQSRYESLGRVVSGAQFTRPKECELLRVIQKEHQRAKGLFDRLVEAYERRPGSGEKAALSAQLQERLVGQLSMASQAMVSQASRLSEMKVLEIEAAQERAALSIMLLVVVMVVVLGVDAMLMARSILRPVKELQKGTDIIGAGNLDYRAGTSATDEIGQLSRAFDQMTERLKAVTVSRDELRKEVRERKRAEEALEERSAELAIAKERAEAADRLKSAFLATMSHELRTPLNSIIGFTGIVLQGLAGPLNDEQTKQLNMVRTSGRHLLALINDVLDLSKIEAGEVEIVKEEFAVPGVIDKVVETVSPLAGQKGLELAVTLSPEVGQIYSDRRRVEQILLNLVNNAVKFTERGRVRIEGAIVDEYLQVSVEDTGIGIKPEDMGTLFQTFRQIQTVSTRDHEGTGLGLSICKKLVTMLGGEIWAESEWGVGSTFAFTLPIEKRGPH